MLFQGAPFIEPKTTMYLEIYHLSNICFKECCEQVNKVDCTLMVRLLKQRTIE